MNRSRSLLLGLLALVACDRAGPPAPGLPVAPDLALDVAASFDVARLTWRSGEAFIEVDIRLAGGPWTPVHAGLPGHAPFTDCLYPAGTPELIEVEARARTIRAGVPSSYVTRQGLRGLRPPGAVTVSQAPPFLVAWEALSAAATEVQLERQLRAPGGEALGPWTPVAATLGLSSATDADLAAWEDGARFGYRVRYAAGEVVTAWSEVLGPMARLLAPTDLRAEVLPAGVQLTWTNRSQRAAVLYVTRYPRGASPLRIGVLPADGGVGQVSPPATQFLHAGAGPGVWTYEVAAAFDAFSGPTWGRTEATLTVQPPGAGPLVLAPLLLPLAAEAGRDVAGEWALADAVFGMPADPALWRGGPGGAGVVMLPRDVRAASPGPLLDASGAAHVVVVDPATGRVTVQTAKDGAWSEEVIATALHGVSIAAAALDAAGALHVAWYRLDAGLPDLRYATNASGAWVVERPAGPGSTQRFNAVALAVDPDGTPFVAGTDNVTVMLFSRSGATWSGEVAPFHAMMASSSHLFALARLAGGTTLVVGEDNAAPGVVHHAAWERTAAGWGPVEHLALATTGESPSPLAVSPDRTRAAFAVNRTSARVHVRGAAGWEAWSLLETYQDVGAGFGPDGRLWVVDGLYRSGITWHDALQAYLLYEEPAAP